MNILIYDNEWKDNLSYLPYNLKFANDEDEVYSLTYNKKFDFYIFNFENGYKVLENLRESGDETFTIFLSNIETFQAQKKAYKIGNEFFKKRLTYVEEIKIKIDYFKKKFFDLDDVIKYKELYFNVRLRIIYKNNKKVELTTLEYELLILFFKNRGKFLSKDLIVEILEIKENSLKVKVSLLRKLGFEIRNTRSLGYKLEENK